MKMLTAAICILALSYGCRDNRQLSILTPNSEADIAGAQTMIQRYSLLNNGIFAMKNPASESEYIFCYCVIPIWTNKGHWFYIEGFMPSIITEPYFQEVLRISYINEDSLISKTYDVKNKERFKMAWYDPGRLESLKASDLIASEGCDAYITENLPGLLPLQASACALMKKPLATKPISKVYPLSMTRACVAVPNSITKQGRLPAAPAPASFTPGYMIVGIS